MKTRPSWDLYGMSLAHIAALRSEDPFCRVGAAGLRKDHSLVATGYNGAPPGIDIAWDDREARRPYVCHAEMNCLKYSKPGEIAALYVSMSPCMSCLTNIAAYKINRVIYSSLYEKDREALTAASRFGISLEFMLFSLKDYVQEYGAK
jgi:dCMP deaminase